MNPNRNVYLLGMPSSGKSTLGRGLARALGYGFVDLDKRIEERAGMSIAQIFEQRGEAVFREWERDELRRVPLDARLVVSTGGGVPCFHDNLEFIKQNGLSVFLDVPVEVLYQRMRRTHRNDRPAFQKDDPALRQTLETRYDQRLPFYRQADATLEGEADAATLLAVVEELLRQKREARGEE
jgi:shikimate kinase